MDVREASAAYDIAPDAYCPTGYRRTEAGVIPADWSVRTLGEIATFLDGRRRPVRDSDRAKMRGSIPYYGASGIVDHVNDHIFDEELILLGEDGENILSRNVPLAFRISGKIWVNNHADVLKPHQGMNIGFLTDRLESINYEKYNSGTAQPKLNKKTCAQIPVAFPPTEAEQESIAGALSDADALIESLQQLIAKKRQIKQGAIQTLVTGEKRLPGFTGEWKELRLDDCATLKARIGWQGLTTNEYLESGDYFLVTGTEFESGYVDWRRCVFVDEPRYRQDRNIQLKAHDVLVTKDGTIGKVALVKVLPGPATLNSGVFVIRPKERAFHPEFFYFLLCSSVFNRFLLQLSAGSTINHLYQKDFATFVFPTPPSFAEQVAIAAFLSEIDAEIAELELRLSKTRQLKQGMMQTLLTGRIRLPLAEPA